MKLKTFKNSGLMVCTNKPNVGEWGEYRKAVRGKGYRRILNGNIFEDSQKFPLVNSLQYAFSRDMIRGNYSEKYKTFQHSGSGEELLIRVSMASYNEKVELYEREQMQILYEFQEYREDGSPSNLFLVIPFPKEEWAKKTNKERRPYFNPSYFFVTKDKA